MVIMFIYMFLFVGFLYHCVFELHFKCTLDQDSYITSLMELNETLLNLQIIISIFSESTLKAERCYSASINICYEPETAFSLAQPNCDLLWKASPTPTKCHTYCIQEFKKRLKLFSHNMFSWTTTLKNKDSEKS